MFSKFHQCIINNFRRDLLHQLSSTKFRHVYIDAWDLQSSASITEISSANANLGFLVMANSTIYRVGNNSFVYHLIPKHLLNYYPELLL